MNGLDAALIWLEGEGMARFWSGFLVFVRVGAVMALLPGFGEHSVPSRVKLAAALAMTLIVAPAVPDGAEITPFAILAEALTGLMIGVGFRLFVVGLQTAGAMAAQATSLAQIFGGAAADPLPAFSHLLTVAGLALALAMGLHVRAAEIMILSHDLMPQGVLPAAQDVTDWGVAQISRVFALAFSLAAPFVIGGVVYNAALGAINRAMPTLMVAFIGAPAITLGGLVLLALTAPLILTVWLGAWQAWLAAPFSVAR